MKNKSALLILSVTASLILLDQLTKYMVRGYMALNSSIPLIKNILHLTYIQNTGAGFGILKSQNMFLIFTSLMIMGMILYYFDRIIKEKQTHIPIALILGGAIGNLIDRLFLGHVTDFIDFRIWPAFNIADSGITIGALLLIFYFWKK